jgi:hypothetical protein
MAKRKKPIRKNRLSGRTREPMTCFAGARVHEPRGQVADL